MKLDFRQRLLTTTLLVGASIVASPAFAQTPPPATPSPPDNSATPQVPETTAPQEGQTVVPSTNAQGGTVRSSQDIVITGTRIPQPNLTSASPVTVLSAQEVKLQGTTRTEDLINSLPQSFAAQGSNVSNGSTGTATVNLRGLGSVRTLVLINGRRQQPGDPRQGSVADINFIPSALIKRVDVLTGGASSVYGADAVAGVVNFIMDTNYRGLRIDGQASTFMHDNRAGANIIQPNIDARLLPAAWPQHQRWCAGHLGRVRCWLRRQPRQHPRLRDLSNAGCRSGGEPRLFVLLTRHDLRRQPALLLRWFVDFGRRRLPREHEEPGNW